MKMEKFTFNESMVIPRFLGFLTLMLISVFSSADLYGQCTLGCNNRVQISLDGDCNVLVTPAMILEGEDTMACDYTVTILGPNDIPIPSSPYVNETHVGRTFKVEVTLTSTGNTCWGQITIEDKQPPLWENCPLVPDTVSCYYNTPFPLPLAYDNCEGLVPTTVISDEVVDLDCDEEFSAMRTIRYQAEDSHGNLSVICTRTVFYERITLDSIVFPPNYDDITLPHLEACELAVIRGIPDYWDLPDPDDYFPGYIHKADDGNGYPDPWVDLNKDGIFDFSESETGVPTTTDGFPIFPNTSYCEINATFSDRKIDICEKSFKVLRTWTLLDWCTSEVRDSFQIIKVLDTTPPDVTCAPDQYNSVFADPYDCSADWVVPAPISIFDCTSTTYTVDYLLADAFGNPPVNGLYIDDNVVEIKDGQGNFSHYIIRDLPVGRTWIRYTVTDACDNSTRCFTEVDVIDNVPPIPVCDEFTVVTLTTNGYAKVFAETFDDGSHDNCTEVGYEVRRMDRDACDEDMDGNTSEQDEFGPYVKFCCEDVGKEIMVVLRVWDDANGTGVYGDEAPYYDRFGQILGYRSDNFNTCMVVTTVQDKIDPVIVCPPDITVDCHEDLTDLSIFGTVREDVNDVEDIEIRPSFIDWDTPLKDGYATDNCSVTVVPNESYQVDGCGVGSIIRTFVATDANGRSSSCTQIITVENRDPYDGPNHPDNDGILDENEWPEDYYAEDQCMELDLHPENLPDPYGFPDLPDDECSQLAITWDDHTFNFVDDVCFKILRTWTVIDWCQFDPNEKFDDWEKLDDNSIFSKYDGYWQYTQVIKIDNTIDPIISQRTDQSFCTYGANCDGFVDLVNAATDDCTAEEDLVWYWELDLDDDGIVDYYGHTNDASDVYPVGKHKITWKVEDMCGNTDLVMYYVYVNDCKNPTPYCISDITTVIMPSSGDVEIWAKDFDLGSTDNCTEHDSLLFTFDGESPVPSLIDEEHYFRGQGQLATLQQYLDQVAQKWIPAGYDNDGKWCPGTSGKIFYCSQEGMNDLDVYVWDEAGNRDFCTNTIHIQSNTDCEDPDPGSPRVAGVVRTYEAEFVEDVMVSMENMQTEAIKYFKTENDGLYQFTEMTMNNDYMLSAEKEGDYLNGVSTLDIVLIQRHILGLQPFDNPYRLIAADINDSKSVSASDIIHLRKLILGIYEELPNNASWRFINASQNFDDIENPWDFVENIELKNLSSTNTNNNFIGVKIGDVNATAVVNARNTGITTRSDEITSLILDNQSFRSGDRVEVPFRSIDMNNILGYQMTLETNDLEFVGIQQGALDVTEDNLGLTQPGMISMSWNNIEAPSVDENEILFTLIFRAKTNNTISNTISVSSAITKAEAYTTEMTITNLELDIVDANDDGVVLLQNRPNPFSESTVISFVLPEAAPATLTVYDISGKLLEKISGNFQAGKNNIELRAENLNASGVLYYQLESGHFKSTKKMILLDR